MTFGRGDAILRYPELIQGYRDDPAALDALDRLDEHPYVAVHLYASEEKKEPPHQTALINGLHNAGVPFVIVGNDQRLGEYRGTLPDNFLLHCDVVRKAAKFIGTLSVFNCVAQLEHIPSFVLVNRSIQEPMIYAMMNANHARIEAWNVGKPVGRIYAEAIEWALS